MLKTICVDTGGTFTDVYVAWSGGIARAKADTTPHDLTVGILDGIGRAAESVGRKTRDLLRDVDLVRFSTTIATNALVTRSGPAVGLLAEGELGDEVVRSLDTGLPLAAELVQSFDGAQPDVVAQGARSLLEGGARLIVIACTGHDNLVAREMQVRSYLLEDYPRHYLGAVPVLCAHQVTLHPDPLMRARTAVVNAYLHPVMSRLLYRAEDQLRADGSRNPLLVATGDAGTARVAKTTAIRTWGSGPAGAMAGADLLSSQLGHDNVVVADVGGTTTDIGVLAQGRWQLDRSPNIDGIELSVPIVDLVSVGIGGGSIIGADGASITVGPASAGAVPGPACFGLGGTDATVTDAALVLGFFDPSSFLGGRRVLDRDLAGAAVELVADAVGSSVERCAVDALGAAADSVANAVIRELERRDVRPADAVLYATGGAGGLLAGEVAARAGLQGFCVFPFTATFSAFGLTSLDIVHSYEFVIPPSATEQAAAATIGQVRRRSEQDLRGEGLDTTGARWSIQWDGADDGDPPSEILLDDEESAARAILASTVGDTPLRLVVAAQIVEADAQAGVARERAEREDPTPIGHRMIVWRAGHPVETPTFAWGSLEPGDRLVGPVIVEHDEATIAVPPGQSVVVGRLAELRSADGSPAGRVAAAVEAIRVA